MLTHLRTWGWLFNPLTTYYVFAPDGTTLATLVLEISNTPWHERFWYVLDAADVGSTPRRFDKAFHVSPFLPMDLTYQCRAPVPDDRLALRFDLSTASSGAAPRRVFTATLAGRRVPLEAPVAVRDVARTATQTAVSAGIYAHAAALAVRARPVPPPPDPFRRQPRSVRRYRPVRNPGEEFRMTATTRLRPVPEPDTRAAPAPFPTPRVDPDALLAASGRYVAPSAAVPVARAVVRRFLAGIEGGTIEVLEPGGNRHIRGGGPRPLRPRRAPHHLRGPGPPLLGALGDARVLGAG